MPTNCLPRTITDATPDDLVDGLRDVGPFAGLDRDALEMIATVAEPVHARAGRALACDKSLANGVVIVLSGTVEVVRICERVAIVDAGGVIGDLADLGFGGRSATLLAGTDVEALHVSGLAFSSLLDVLPDAWRHLQPLVTTATA